MISKANTSRSRKANEVERRQFGLRDVANLAVLLGGAGLIEKRQWGACLRMASRQRRAPRPVMSAVIMGERHDSGTKDMAEVVKFVGLGLVDGVVNGVLVGQIAVEQVELVVAHQVVDEAETGGRLGNTTHQPVDGVALLEEELAR